MEITPLQLATDEELYQEIINRTEDVGGIIIVRMAAAEDYSGNSRVTCLTNGEMSDIVDAYAFLTARLSLAGVTDDIAPLISAVNFWKLELSKNLPKPEDDK